MSFNKNTLIVNDHTLTQRHRYTDMPSHFAISVSRTALIRHSLPIFITLQNYNYVEVFFSPVHSGTLSANEYPPVGAGPSRVRLVAIGASTVLLSLQ